MPAPGAPVLGGHCLASAPPVLFLGTGMGEMWGNWGASPQAGHPTAYWDKGHPLREGNPKPGLQAPDYHQQLSAGLLSQGWGLG